MKTTSISPGKKLLLQKDTISLLDAPEAAYVLGGATAISKPCASCGAQTTCCPQGSNPFVKVCFTAGNSHCNCVEG